METPEMRRDFRAFRWTERLASSRRPPTAWTFPLRGARAVFRDFPRARLMASALVTYVRVSLLARLRSLPAAFAAISPAVRSDGRAGEPMSIVSAVDALLGARIPGVRPQCWRRAAILHRHLALAGIETTIVFGVRALDGGALEAHAWLERRGAPFQEPRDVAGYRRIYAFPLS